MKRPDSIKSSANLKIAALEAENLKLQKQIARLQVENLTEQHKIVALEGAMKELTKQKAFTLNITFSGENPTDPADAPAAENLGSCR